MDINTSDPKPLIDDQATQRKANNRKSESKALQFFWLCVSIAMLLLSFWAAYGDSLFCVPLGVLALIVQRIAYTERLSQVATQ